MGAWLAAKLGSTIFKAVGIAVIITLAFVSIKYGLASIKIDSLTAQNAQLTKEKAAALVTAATWEATFKANEAELKRVSTDLDLSRARAAQLISEQTKARTSAEAAYRELKAQVANVATTDDRHLGPVGNRGYAGLLANHSAKTAP